MLRIPEDEAVESNVIEDELNCLNLNVSIPSDTPVDAKLPVLIWIHGGSQAVTFPSAASKIGDPTRIVAQSAQEGRPMIFISFNYRLNIFAFGDGNGEKNLALQDQRLVIDWVQKHIAGFGGDSKNIIVAGESAGAVYAHAQLVKDLSLKGILASGSLYLSAPIPQSMATGIRDKILSTISKDHPGHTLASATAETLVQAIEKNNIVSFFLEEDSTDEALSNWQTITPHIKRLMIGDVEHEGSIWRVGQDKVFPAELISAFDNGDPEYGPQLRKIYGIVEGRHHSCRNGVVDFITDARFVLPVEDMWATAKKEQDKDVQWYRYLFDEPNPWQASSRAHHAVDLIMLFGGIDFNHNPHAEAVGQMWRSKWTRFVAGEEPWEKQDRFAFGPFGKCGVVGEFEFGARRRVRALKVLKEMTWARYNPIFAKVAAGKISLIDM